MMRKKAWILGWCQRWVVGAGVAWVTISLLPSGAKDLTRLRVASDTAHLIQEDGKGFFYFAENAWPLAHTTPLPQLRKYAEARKDCGITVIHVAIGEPGKPLSTPNYRGFRPFAEDDPGQPMGKPGPANDYWDQLEQVIEVFSKLELRTGIAPAWGHEAAFTDDNAKAFGRFLGERYKKHSAKVVWILGDGTVDDTTKRRNVWREMASGIEDGSGGAEMALLTSIMRKGTSSGEVFHVDRWQDFHSMHRSSESAPAWSQVEAEAGRTNPKPFFEMLTSLDQSANASPANADADAYRERRDAYWSVFGGAMGYTLNRNVTTAKDPTSDLERATQLGYLRRLFDHRPLAGSVADREILFDDSSQGTAYAAALKGKGYGMVYVPEGHNVEISLPRLGITKPRATWWFNPRNGESQKATPIFAAKTYLRFDPPGEPKRTDGDWVLILDGEPFPEP